MLGKDIEDNVLAHHRASSRSPKKEENSKYDVNASIMSKANTNGLDKKFISRMNKRLKEEKFGRDREILHQEYFNMDEKIENSLN